MKNFISLNRRSGVLALAALVLAGCGGSEPEQPAPPPVVAVVKLAPSRLDLTEDLPARISALRVAEIRSQVGGIVQRRLFEQGTEVRAGQALFQIDPAPFKAEVDTAAAALQRAEAVLSRAKAQALRLQPLAEADAVSGQALDDALSQRDQAIADAAQARATLARRELDLKFALVAAPIAGRIDQALVTEGALVGTSDSGPMARIQQIDQVYVDVRLPAPSLEVLRESLKLSKAKGGTPVMILRSDGSSYDAKGSILFSGINVEPGTGDVLLRVMVDNAQRQLLPGMFVRARVPMASYPDALSVPQQAVVRIAGKPQVWTLDAKGKAALKPVELGELIGRQYRIRSGLSAGDAVVTEGMERLSDGIAVNAQGRKPSEAAASEPQKPAASSTSTH